MKNIRKDWFGRKTKNRTHKFRSLTSTHWVQIARCAFFYAEIALFYLAGAIVCTKIPLFNDKPNKSLQFKNTQTHVFHFNKIKVCFWTTDFAKEKKQMYKYSLLRMHCLRWNMWSNVCYFKCRRQDRRLMHRKPRLSEMLYKWKKRLNLTQASNLVKHRLLD